MRFLFLFTFYIELVVVGWCSRDIVDQYWPQDTKAEHQDRRSSHFFQIHNEVVASNNFWGCPNYCSSQPPVSDMAKPTETIYCTSVDVDWWYGSWDTEHHLFHSAFYILFQDKAPPWIRIIWISYIMKNSHALILGNKYLKAYNTLLFFAIISCRTWVCCRGQNAFNLLKTVSICKTWDQKAANVFRVVSVRGGGRRQNIFVFTPQSCQHLPPSSL